MIDSIVRLLDPLGHAKKNGMIVGKNVSLAGKQGTSFGSEPYLIELEDEVRISGGVKFFTHDGGTWAFRDIKKYEKVFKYGKIKVGFRTFIGHGAIILPGVNIGSRCVIGAGAVVTKSVPDGMVVAGCPARIIMTTEEYAEKILKAWSLEEWDLELYDKKKKDYLVNKYMKKKGNDDE